MTDHQFLCQKCKEPLVRYHVMWPVDMEISEMKALRGTYVLCLSCSTILDEHPELMTLWIAQGILGAAFKIETVTRETTEEETEAEA